MRISLVLLFAVVLQLSAENGYAQKIGVAISMSNASIEQVLNRIEETSDYVFLYNDKTIQTNRIVSVSNKSGKILDILDEIFRGTNVTYTMVDKQIILSTQKLNVTDQSDNKILLKGLVKDAGGEPLIGVNVKAQGASGTITDINGNFNIQVKIGESIEFSYVGYVPQIVKVTGNQPLNIILQEDNKVLSEVVVTALGIKREAKALTYNVQELKSDAITGVKDASFVTSLQGKIAGVTINQSANGIGGSTRVVMRGTKSLFGDNNALNVVDGIPLSSMRSEQPMGSFEVPDGGDSDGISSLNPDDIETMSVLTGAAAAALYGAAGANGVVLITTKKGTEGKLSVSYSNDTQFLMPFVMPKFQNTYGRKKEGVFESWGNKLATPSSYDPKDFFQTGFTETNSLSVTSGTDRNQTYFSASSINAAGIIPNNKYNRYNFTLRNTTELIKDRLTLDMSASYIIQNNQNMISQGQAHNPLVPLYLFPPGDDIEKYKTYEHYNAERNFNTQFWPYGNKNLAMQNPWWIVNREFFNNNKQRYMFTGSLNWKITSWMRATGRLRVDNSEDTYTRKISASSDKLFASDYGNYQKMRTQYKNFYADAILNIDKKFGIWGVNANIGGSVTDEIMGDVTGFEGNLVTVPNLFTVENIDRNDAETNMLGGTGVHYNSQSAFATVQFSYKSALFLDVTGRNDWASTFAFTSNEKKGYFYPSVGLSFVPTEMFDLSKTPISFMKLRASYSEVGNAPKPYVSSLSYKITRGKIEDLPSLPATGLKPERTKAFEVGANIRLFKDKINFDVTYYSSNTYNQFFTLDAAPSTGYKEYHVNSGKVKNWGVEAMLGYKEKLGQVNWNSTLTFTMNRNKIKELLSESARNPITNERVILPYMDIVTMGTYKQRIEEGGSIGDIYVQGLKTDHQGYIYVNPQDGSVQADSENWIKAGNSAPKYNFGWNNTFSYKGFSLGFLIDARLGGICVSATQALMDRFGTSQASADARDNGGVMVNGGKVNTEKYYSVVGGGTTGLLAFYTYSATNVRLREATLGYTFPDQWFRGAVKNVKLSLIGKNLFMFYHKAPFDPELASSTGTYYQGIDFFMQPSLRNVGFSLKFQF